MSFGLLCRERGQRDADEANAFRDRKQRLQQRIRELFEFAGRGDSYLTGWLRVIRRKLANLTLSVTVRP